MKIKFDSLKVNIVDVVIDFSRIIEKSIEVVFNDEFLKCLNEQLSKDYITNIELTSEVVANTYRKFVIEFAPNLKTSSKEGIELLIKETRSLLSQMNCVDSIHILNELNSIEQESREYMPESELGNSQTITPEQDMIIVCDTLIVNDNSNISVDIDAHCINNDSEYNLQDILRRLTLKALGVFMSGVIAFAINSSIEHTCNNYRYDVMSKITGKPQISTVVDDYVHVYEDDNSHSERVGRLLYGDKVEIVGSSEYWYKVKFLNPLNEVTTGYIPNRSVDYFIQ